MRYKNEIMPKTTEKKISPKRNKLHKCPTGIKGFDEITEGGLPKNRISLICGSTGSGKTLFGIDFLINGVINYNEPGVFMSFEETEDELYKNVASLNLDLQGLVSQKKILLDYVLLERRDIQEKGEFNLEGLFVRLELAIDSIGAKRVVIDSIDSLFAGLADDGILRLEIKRLFRWLKEKQVTTIVTGELVQSSYTRQGMEEYISDCIILLAHTPVAHLSTPTARLIQYPGSKPGTCLLYTSPSPRDS